MHPDQVSQMTGQSDNDPELDVLRAVAGLSGAIAGRAESALCANSEK
jgi:hypothetical protein